MKRDKIRIMGIEKPVECVVLERVNKFVVRVLIDRKPRRAYINNTGRLLKYLARGRKGFCIRRAKLGKTDCRLFSIKEDGSAAIIDTQLQMKAFERALEMDLIPWMRQSKILKRNAKLGKSSIDYLLECGGERVYLEVKSAVLKEGEYATYPDCPSARGRRHIKELTDHVKEGGRGTILFIAALPEVKAFRPNRSADPELHGLLVEAHSAGVNLKSIGLYYSPRDSSVHLFAPDLEVSIS